MTKITDIKFSAASSCCVVTDLSEQDGAIGYSKEFIQIPLGINIKYDTCTSYVVGKGSTSSSDFIGQTGFDSSIYDSPIIGSVSVLHNHTHD